MEDIFKSRPEETPSQGSGDEGASVSDDSGSKGEEVPLKKKEGTIENLQSKYDKFVKEAGKKEQALELKLEETQEQFTRLQRQLEELKKPPKAESLKPPVLPQRPSNFDYTDALTDPDSLSGKYQAAERQYFIDLAAYQMQENQILKQEVQQVQKRFQSEDEIKQIQLNAAQAKAQTIAKFKEKGLDDSDALQAYNMFNKLYNETTTDEAADQAVKMYRLLNPKSPKTKIPRTNREEYPTPPGVQSGGGLPTEEFEDEFMSQAGGRTKEGLFDTRK